MARRSIVSWRIALLAVFVAIMLFALPVSTFAAKVAYLPATEIQGNGTPIHLYMSGDEFFNYQHTANGSLIMQNDEGNFVYSTKRFDGVLIPGTVRVDSDPFYKGLTIKDVDIKANVKAPDMMADLIASTKPKFSPTGEPLNASGTLTGTDTIATTPTGDTALTHSALTNVVCYIRFAGEAEFAPAQVATDNELLNTGTYSLDNYIKAQSEGACSFKSVMPKGNNATVASFCATQTRGYFQPYNATTNPIGYVDDAAREVREHTLLAQAVAWMNQMGDIPAGANLDRNNDGNVDAIMFIVNGDAGAWSSLLWPHQWDMQTTNATLSGKKVMNYSFELQNFEPTRKLSTYCHESMHVLGFPDLYRYYAAGDPIAMWDIMNQDTQTPQYANAYMRKTIANWGPAVAAAKIGTNVVRAPSASGSAPESIAIPVTTQQSFVFEYRKNTPGTFDQNLPSSGLLPYRILTIPQANAYGNMYGPNYYPDGYYIFRPGVTDWGTIPWYNSAGYGLGATNGGGTAPATWTLSSSNGRSTYGSPGVPADSLFVYGGTQVEYYIGNVSANTSDTISFDINTVNDFNHYIVDFNTQGGTPAIPSQSIYAGQTSTVPTTTPTRSGYTFKGWFTSAEGTQTFDFTNTKILKNTTVYAQWNIIPPTSGQTTTDNASTNTVEERSSFSLSGYVLKDASGALNVVPGNSPSALRNASLAGTTPVEGATVYLQKSYDGGSTWTTDTSISDVTDATGAYTLTFTPDKSMMARAYVPEQMVGTTKLASMTSSAIAISVTRNGSPIPASSRFTVLLLVVAALSVGAYASRKRAIE